MQQVVTMDKMQRGRSTIRGAGWFLPLVILIYCLFGSTLSAQASGGDILWKTVDAVAGKQQAVSVVRDGEGNLIVSGYQNLSGGVNDDFYTVKVKADGSVAWRVSYDKAGGSDLPVAVAVDQNSDVIVTGYVWSGASRNIETVKYSGSSGAVLWQHEYNGSANGNDLATAVSVAVDGSNNVFVGGYSQNSAGNDDMVILKYLASGPVSGAPSFSAGYSAPLPGNSHLSALAASLDGIVATGQSWNGTGFDFITLKFDLSGNKVWEVRHQSPGGGMGKKVRIDPSGNVVVAGYAANSTDKDIYLAKYNGTSGALLWEKSYNGGSDEEPNDLYLDQQGDVYLTGYSWSLSSAEDFFTARYSGVSGAVIWQQSFDGGTGGTDVASTVVVDEAGDLFVTGYTVSAAASYNVVTLKYKRDNGNLLWQSLFTGSGLNQRPAGMALSDAGDPMVAGWSDGGGGGLDLFAIKYDAGLLNPPTTLTTNTLSDTSIALTWSDNSPNENGFLVERRLGDSGSFVQIATLPAGTVSFTDPGKSTDPGYSGLTPSNLYYYRVRAYNAGGYSHYSNEAKGLTVFVTFTPPAWSYIYNNPDNGDDFANAVAVGPDNHPVVTGYSQRTQGGFDYYTLKLSRADKSVLWSDLYDDPDSEMDMATCVAVDGSNNAVVSGFSQLFSSAAERNINSIYTMKYPTTGAPQSWGAQYNGPGAIDDRAVAVANTVDAASSVVVLGYGKNSANNDDIYLVKYNPGGTLAWAATPYNGGGEDIPAAVAVGADGSIYLTGYSERPGTGLYNLFTAKYNGSTGALIWSDSYSVVPGGDNRARSLALDAKGDLYVTGWALSAAGNRDIYTVKYNGAAVSAQRVWERSVDGSAHGDDDAVAVKVDPIDGNIIIAGSTLTGAGDHDVTIVRFSADGDLIWQKTLFRPGFDDNTSAMALDPSGSIYLAANTLSGGTSHVISLIYSYDGTLLGAGSYSGTGNDEATSLAVNTMGEAFIAGYSTNGTGNADYLLMKQNNAYNVLVPAPFTAAAQSDYSKILLNWVSNSAGASYRIERTLGPVSVNSTWLPITSTAPNAVSFQDSGLNPGTGYCYRIEATVGSLSSRKIVTCTTTALSAPVLNPAAPISSTAVDLSWGNVAGNSGYRLERSTDNANWTQIGGGNLAAGTTLYHDTGLTAGTVYFYRVSALNVAGASLPSVVQVAPVLNALSGVTSTALTLSWPAVAGNTGYRVERSTDNVNWSQVAAPLSSALSWSDSALNPGTLYYYRLRAVTLSGVSGGSLTQSASTKLVAPQILTASAASTTALALTWSDPNPAPSVNETGFLLEYALCNYDNPNSCVITNDSYYGSWSSATAAANSTGTTLSGLLTGRTYRVRVSATLSGANSVPSSVVGVTTALAAPGTFSATATSSSVVRLAWSDVTGETGYRILVNGAVLTGVNLLPGTTYYDVTGLAAGSTYTFQVQPYNSATSATSTVQSVTMPVTAPLVSTPVAVSSTEVDLAWTDVPGIANYEIWRAVPVSQSNPGGTWNVHTLLTSPAAGVISYQDKSVSAGYSYRYEVRYKLADGTYSAYSAPQQVTTIPPTPTALTATGQSPTQIYYSWSTVYGPTGYNVQYKVRSGSDCNSESWSGVTTYQSGSNYYTASNLSATSAYCFRVNAYNAAGSSAWTSAVTKLPPPTLNDLSGITFSQIALSWGDVTGNTGYRVERSTDTYSFSQVGSTLAAGTTSFTDSGLTNNTTYYYRVRTMLSADPSAPSFVKSATTLPAPVPVLNTLSGITTTQMVLGWNMSAGNSGYKVERSLDNINWSQVATTAVNAASYTDAGLTAGTLYYYRVSTVTSSGTSLPSNVQSATTKPAAPVLKVSAGSEATMNLSWQEVLGATNYKVLRSVGSAGPYSQAANLALPYTASYCGFTLPTVGCLTAVPISGSYLDAGLAQNVQYCYQLIAWNLTGGDSAPSATVCVKTPSVTAPTAASASAVNSRAIRISWIYNPAACTPVACGTADGFEVWRQLENGEWGLWQTVFAANSAYDNANVDPLHTYSYKLRAFKGADFSAYSAPVSVATPAYTSTDTNCVAQ